MAMQKYAKQDEYRRRKVDMREHWYLDVGPTKDDWRAMSASQQAIHKRWYKFYQQRRVIRELLRGDS